LRPLGVALAASLGLHLVVAALFLTSLKPPPTPPEPAPLQVMLLPNLPWLAPTKPSPPARPVSAPRSAKAAATSSQTPGAPTKTTSTPAPEAAEPALGALAAGVRAALRTSIGCSDPVAEDLNEDERTACRRRRAAIGHDAPTYAVEPADPVKAAEFDREAQKSETLRREMEGPMPDPPCVGAWCKH
jgi:hypothetical protein